MALDLSTLSNAKYYILDQNFTSIMFLDDYESMLWIERYNDTGDFELYTPPTRELIDACKINNYIWASFSEELMIIESVQIRGDIEGGPRLIAVGRSLSSILDRRIVLYKTLVKNVNMEDAILRLINYGFRFPTDPVRKIDNLDFAYSNNSDITSTVVDYEYEKGTDILEIIQTACKDNGIGFRIRKNASDRFIFQLYKGEDRSYSQEKNPWVVFSPEFDNIITSSTKEDARDMKNYIYTEGEVYENQAPETVEHGTAVGLLRREFYNNASQISHKIEDENGQEVVLSDSEYHAQLVQNGYTVFREKRLKKEVDGEVEPSINFVYGRDYFMGDIVQMVNDYGFNERVRVTEFMVSHSTSGLEVYPTFSALDEEEEP